MTTQQLENELARHYNDLLHSYTLYQHSLLERQEARESVVVLSRVIGDSLPLTVVVYREEPDRWLLGTHAMTFRGNRIMAMASGSATFRYLLSKHLHEYAERIIGQRFINQLVQLMGDFPHGDVRGRRLIGVKVIGPYGKKSAAEYIPSALYLTSVIQTECLRHGLIIELGGRHGSVVQLLPPLIIAEAQADRVCDIFTVAVYRTLSSSQIVPVITPALPSPLKPFMGRFSSNMASAHLYH